MSLLHPDERKFVGDVSGFSLCHKQTFSPLEERYFLERRLHSRANRPAPSVELLLCLRKRSSSPNIFVLFRFHAAGDAKDIAAIFSALGRDKTQIVTF
jgi:hypothetical protein